MIEHDDPLFLGGWHKCVKHVTNIYPSIHPAFIMEAEEKARLLRKRKKANSLGIHLKDLDKDDSASDFGSDDDDNDGAFGDRALIPRSEPLVGKSSIPELEGAKDSDDLPLPPA